MTDSSMKGWPSGLYVVTYGPHPKRSMWDRFLDLVCAGLDRAEAWHTRTQDAMFRVTMILFALAVCMAVWLHLVVRVL